MSSIREHPRRSMDHGAQHTPPPATTATRRRKTDQGAMNPIEATVTKLLVATKQLLEGLTLWANRRMTEEQVSDIFVLLATQFNLASQAFHEVGIDTSELAHIPDDLRGCLETALGEDPSPTSLDQYLPRIKEIIINLLQGLRLKQNLYRERYEAKAARPQAPPSPPTTTTNVSSSPQSSSATPAAVRKQTGVKQAAPSGKRGTSLSGASAASPSMRTLAAAPAPSPTLSVTSPRDDPSHADTLASLRKTDAITRRASSRRHSQRFSTLLEQNTPWTPKRQHPASDSGLMASYPIYANSQGTASSLPVPPHFSVPLNQLPPLPTPTYDQFPSVPGHPVPGAKGNMNAMPMPPTNPIPSSPSDAQQAYPTPPVQATDDAPTPPLSVADSANVTEDTAAKDSATISTSSNVETTKALSASETLQPSVPATGELIEPVETSLTLFLQVGKSVKKTKFEGDLTLSGLRMLFMEKFQYNPGQDDFPTIYVKDPNTNIHYELESLADVRQNAFLSLNVDDLENMQRKMDQGFATLAKELHEIRKAHENMEQARQKAATAAVAAAAAAAAAAVNNQSDRAATSTNPESPQLLRSVVQRAISKNKITPSASSSTTTQNKVSAAELRSHYDEVQTLRRDLGVVRQLYTDLQNETKSMLSNLVGYTSQMRKQAQDAPMSSRLFIESGKVKLDKKSEDLTNKIEDLQDVVEDMKLNVTQRRGRPSDSSMAFVDKQCEDVGREIGELSDYIQTLRPSWKKTWEVELQTIVKEQMFLKEQEALLEDLKEDRNSLLQTLVNLKKVMELQAKSGTLKTKEYFFQPVVDENFEGLKTVLEEVKLIAPDSDKRLKAMAQMEKLRHIELSNRIDEFEQELTTFVGASKLRKTGGALEVERQRQQRDSENLKAMFAVNKKTAENNTDDSGNAVETIEEEVKEEQAEQDDALLVEEATPVPPEDMDLL
ncbi:Bud site selection protein 6 [Gamsiella multidivaricata]|nr:Bud site selection protein 6 [Gamsiella multidivaricata]